MCAARLEVRHEPAADLRGVHQSSPSCVVLVGRAIAVGRASPSVGRRVELGDSMRHEPEALAQLGFGLGLALRDLVAEHPGAEGQRLPAGR